MSQTADITLLKVQFQENDGFNSVYTHSMNMEHWVKVNWQETTDVLAEHTVSVSRYPPEIPSGLLWEWFQNFEVRCKT